MPARVDFRPEPELMCFGKMVKQAREQMGISQDQLAEKVGISVGYVAPLNANGTNGLRLMLRSRYAKY